MNSVRGIVLVYVRLSELEHWYRQGCVWWGTPITKAGDVLGTVYCARQPRVLDDFLLCTWEQLEEQIGYTFSGCDIDRNHDRDIILRLWIEKR